MPTADELRMMELRVEAVKSFERIFTLFMGDNAPIPASLPMAGRSPSKEIEEFITLHQHQLEPDDFDFLSQAHRSRTEVARYLGDVSTTTVANRINARRFRETSKGVSTITVIRDVFDHSRDEQKRQAKKSK